jgi:CRP-like cAMP-binding protein
MLQRIEYGGCIRLYTSCDKGFRWPANIWWTRCRASSDGNNILGRAFSTMTLIIWEPMTPDPPFSALVHKLRRLGRIDSEDEDSLLSLPHRVTHVAARDYLVREGTVPDECCLLIEGYASRSKVAMDGGRQIVSFHIAGDILDLQHLFLEQADHDVQAITDATIVWIPMAALRSLATQRPRIGIAFWRDALIDASIFREWVLNVGRRDAKTRIAHMLCEFIARSASVGLGTPQRMQLPFTQEEIADATGLTPVHVNRMLRELTDDGLITQKRGYLEIADWAGFRRVAGFDPTYLHAAA